VGQVLAWASVLLAFGSIQGVIYLKAYWGRFGLDPFQFSDASSLSLVGLTGIGVTVAVMGIAALVGGWLGQKLDEVRSKHRVVGITIGLSLLVGLALMAYFVDWGIYLVIGVLLTWFLLVLAHHSPLIPAALTRSSWLPYLALAVAYVPLASHHYGHRQADKVMNSSIRAKIDESDDLAADRQGLRLVGRLGDGYVLYRPMDRSVLVVPAATVNVLLLTPEDRPTSACCSGGERDRPSAPPSEE